MLRKFTIFLPLGLFIVVVALVAMAVVCVLRFRAERAYDQGQCYIDEFERKDERLASYIPLCGALLLSGLIVIVINFMVDPDF
ncbi:MAG: hypothetical protein SNG27_01800 [Rikenellaceae bacterium]